MLSDGRWESGTHDSPDRLLIRAGAGVLLAIGIVQGLLWAGFPVHDPRLICVLAVAFAASRGGPAPALLGWGATLAYCAFFFSRIGPRPHEPLQTVWLLLVYAGVAGAIAVMLDRMRRRTTRVADRDLHAERGRVADLVRENASLQADAAALNQAIIESLPAEVMVLDAEGRVVSTNRAGLIHVSVGADYFSVLKDNPAGGQITEGIREVLDGKRAEFTCEYAPAGATSDKSSPDSQGVDQPAPDQRWMLLLATPLAKGRGIVVTHLDITDRLRAEQKLRHRAAELDRVAQSLRRSNEELDQFAYVTSHDLRAPLRGIANLSNWIEEDMADRFTPEAHRQMELLRGRVHRMEAMIDGILEYSRVGRVKAKSQRIDVAELLAEVVDLLDVPARMTVEVEPGMPIVFGDKLRLQQVLMNLIGNALKHHDKPDGRIRVASRDEGAFVQLSVSDDGPGIEPQYHEKIFVIFQTLKPRDQVEGTGVGLSLVKKIVETFGGRVWVESTPGGGTTFHFTWPRNVADEKGHSSETAQMNELESVDNQNRETAEVPAHG